MGGILVQAVIFFSFFFFFFWSLFVLSLFGEGFYLLSVDQ